MRPIGSDPKWSMCYHSPMPESNDHNLINFIASTVEAMRIRIDTISEQMATKVDLANLRDEMATKEELAALRDEMATKDGLARLETIMHGEFEQVHIRIDSIDRGMGSRMGLIETDVSRMRSVLYLLVKDKPDMLRLLGQPTPGEGRPQG